MELTSKQSIDSLHFRHNGRIYETRTPDGESAGAHTQQQLAGQQTGLSQHWDDETITDSKTDVKGKGRAMTLADGKLENTVSPPSSRSSIASDEDDELLPSFGGEQDYDRPVSSYKHKVSSSNSRTSLGLHQNGFISRDDMLRSDGSDNNDHDDQGAISNDSEKQYGKQEDVSKPRKKKRKSKDRYNAGRFAKEMAFVVSSPCMQALLSDSARPCKPDID